MASTTDTLLQLERDLLDPVVRADAARLDALVADDFLEVGASGRSFGKDEVMTRLPVEQDVAFTAEAMQAHVLAEGVVLVTYVAERRSGGETVRSLRSSIWIRTARGWQMRYHQGTPTAGP
ncbi:DUF4440 domain-containing protein [Dokdonella sp. MW10]|uniref:nuclear transport factor 2 family protein n=1 Tax=Dokdonella sp. MW10 TaxID=2992926 RepID=UPI003F80FF8E